MKSKGTASFLIKDLLTAPPSQVGFTQHNINFVQIFLCGVISKRSWSSKGDKLVYKIEDGTGCINCILETNRSSLVDGNKVDMERLEKETSDNVLSQMALITAISSNQLLKRTSCQDLKPGDYVRIIGKLNLYHGQKRVFIDKIERCADIETRINYLQTLCYLYKNIYTLKA